jgi:hypothetical protein
MDSGNSILSDLRDRLVVPILDALSAEQRGAVVLGPLLFVVLTAPPKVSLYAFAEGAPVHCGHFELPERAGPPLAEFFQSGLNQLDAANRRLVATAIASERAQLTCSLRPDLGEAVCYVVTRNDAHPPVKLFSLTAQPDWTLH